MGRGELIERLAAQVGSKAKALLILKRRGHVDEDGNLTPTGKKRDSMTAEERAKDRAAKTSKRKPSDYNYNPKTNRATLTKRKKRR